MRVQEVGTRVRGLRWEKECWGGESLGWRKKSRLRLQRLEVQSSGLRVEG